MMTITSTNANDPEPSAAFVTCVVCAIEVPPDEALVPEVADRLLYLCGLDCYARWRVAVSATFPTLGD